MIYLDNNATTLMPPQVMRAMVEWCNRGNPSSGYAAARAARKMMTDFREYLANLCGFKACCAEDRDAANQDNLRRDTTRYKVIFTSGASEANATAISAVIRREQRPHVIISAIEHKSIILMVESYEKQGICDATYIQPTAGGHILPADVEAALRPNTCLVSVMHANNESGAINDIAAIGRVCRTYGVHFHCDTVQTFGKTPLNPITAAVDSFSVSFHKFGGPPGIGVLVFRQEMEIQPIIFGTQNEGLRGGTENLPGIGAAYVAAKITMIGRRAKNDGIHLLKRRLMAGLAREFPTCDYSAYHAPRYPLEIVFISGAGATYLANTVLLSVVSNTYVVCNAKLKEQLESAGIVVSVGSACNTASAKASHVLYAMGADEHIRKGALRISLGDDNTEAEINTMIREFSAILRRITDKKMS